MQAGLEVLNALDVPSKPLHSEKSEISIQDMHAYTRTLAFFPLAKVLFF